MSMKESKVKFVIFGLGMVGSSFLRIVKKEGLFDANSWYVIDKSSKNADVFVKIGGKTENFLTINIQWCKYDNIFSLLNAGDYLLDFSSSESNTDLLQICISKNIHYLSTCSLPHEEPGESVPDYHDFCIYRNIKKNTNSVAPTSIIEFGMNPGMVSCFMKQAIKEIVRKDTGNFVTSHKDRLQSLLDCNKYAEVAQLLEIETIHVSDIDTTEPKFSPRPNIIYSTWNVESFYKETTALSEISLGTDIDCKKLSKIMQEHNTHDGFFMSKNLSIYSSEQSYSPQGSFMGYIVPHEEIYSISNFLSIYKGSKLVYKPSVYFVYLPCPISTKSLFENVGSEFDLTNTYLMEPKDMSKGGEAVGIVIDGKNFQTRYFGNNLEGAIGEDTPTILQVSASAYAAFRYMLEMPNQGFLFPEELDDEKILKYALPYLKEYVSFATPSLKRTFFKKYGA